MDSDQATVKHPERIQFLDMEAFMKEQEEIEKSKASTRQKTQLLTQSKKKAKKLIDEETLALAARAEEEIGDTNWIGKLLEYRQVHPVAEPSITYSEVTINGTGIARFICSLLIAESGNPFGGSQISFSSKKIAKQFASKRAIDWLIENHYMPDDGSVKFPKLQPPPPTKPSSCQQRFTLPATAKVDPTSTTTYARQVPALCYHLGFNVPKYEIHPVVEESPLYDAYADFAGDPRVMGKVGEVKNVFGRKKAKEEVARRVISFLKDIERQRLEQNEDEDRKRKRSFEGMGMEEPGKTVEP